MVSVTLSITDKFKDNLKNLSWINWSDIAKTETQKKLVFERYMKTKKVSGEDWKFCESIDWHPVDELPLKKSFIKRMEKVRKGKGKKFRSVAELERHLGL